MDVKNPEVLERTLAVIGAAYVLIEEFRPAVMERLGLGPEISVEIHSVDPLKLQGNVLTENLVSAAWYARSRL